MDLRGEVGVSFDALLPRSGKCVQCSAATPACPKCPDGQSCQITVPVDCTQCPRSYCAQNSPTPTPQPSSGQGGPSAGAIAGGVIGGLAAIAIVTYLVWRFCIKTKRQALAQQEQAWDEEHDQTADEREKSFAQRRDQRASTHTVGSIASTVLTRASNIIQIAYIPGVTNRAQPHSPTVLVPPVPPIPIAHAGGDSPTSTRDDEHFFVPGNLRDSTYSGVSAYTDRTSYARTSYAPRSSIASTIYGKSAVVQAPAVTGMRAKPTMVSMKSNSSGGSGTTAPPVPAVDYEKYAPLRPPSPAASAFSVGSTFLNNASAHTATTARVQMVRIGQGKGPKMVGPSKAEATSKVTEVSEESSIPEPSTTPDSKLVSTARQLSGEDSPSTNGQSPFSDPPTPRSPQKHKSSNSISAVIEEATKRASQRDSTKSAPPAGRPRGASSPFSDSNATHDD